MSPEDPNLFPWWVKYSSYAALASFGGFMGALLRAQHDGKPFSWKRVLIEAVASGFVGLLVMLVCNELQFSERWTGVIVGVFGWLGANASIVMLEQMIYKKIGLSKPNGAPDVHPPQDPPR